MSSDHPYDSSLHLPSPLPTSNHLAQAKSPYLLQHARNPVNWYSWGKDAFAQAVLENKVIFLSIGYSTCHWCHVMEKESFENQSIASFLNQHFINIKVDREERPDVDRVYMTFVQATIGRGGWPLSLWLTPDLQPIFGGTYFPPEASEGRVGFLMLLERIAALWSQEESKVREQAQQVTHQLRHFTQQDAFSGERDQEEDQAENQPEDQDRHTAQDLHRLRHDPRNQYRTLREQAIQELAQDFDPQYGGFGGAPKFPRPAELLFLLTASQQQESEDSGNALPISIQNTPSSSSIAFHTDSSSRTPLNMAIFTLERMAQGGIWDAVGGGFHRYAVDETWSVPHFEKMLYDQAQLAEAYLLAFQLTGKAHLKSVACRILDYVLRDLTAPTGGFYAAEDADSWPVPEEVLQKNSQSVRPTGSLREISSDSPSDSQPASRNTEKSVSEKMEGAFYLWSWRELQQVLSPEVFQLMVLWADLRPQGNIPLEFNFHGEFLGKNILESRRSVQSLAQARGQTEEEVQTQLNQGLHMLFQHRITRPRPHRDEKILTAWNGLMVSALTKGYQLLGEVRYLQAAQAAVRFVKAHLYDFYDEDHPNEQASRRLIRSWYDGSSGISAFAEDYAAWIRGLLDLYESDFDPQHLAWAMELQEIQDKLFWDAAQDRGGYFSSSPQEPHLFLHLKSDSDGAEPSANSLSTINRLRFSALLGRSQDRKKAELLLQIVAQTLQHHPVAMPWGLIALAHAQTPVQQVVLVGAVGLENVGALEESEKSEENRNPEDVKGQGVGDDLGNGMPADSQALVLQEMRELVWRIGGLGRSVVGIHDEVAREFFLRVSDQFSFLSTEFVGNAEEGGQVEGVAGKIRKTGSIRRKVYARVCTDGACGLPVQSVEELLRVLGTRGVYGCV